jgi:hypothetical protein
LRKLSDEFEDPTYDPKTVISDLEDAGAVRLEKRRGTPYDYTVLIVERTHPDVQIIARQYAESAENDAAATYATTPLASNGQPHEFAPFEHDGYGDGDGEVDYDVLASDHEEPEVTETPATTADVEDESEDESTDASAQDEERS